MSWIEMNDKVWPPPEKITKRLKKILNEVGRQKTNNFNTVVSESQTGLSKSQKIDIILKLTNRGLMSTPDCPCPYTKLIDDVSTSTNELVMVTAFQMEAFVEKV